MDSHAARITLYPAIEPNAQGWLDLDGRHEMYWEESGSRDGVPVVFVHGGPGAGSAPVHRRFFDPRFYRIIVYDQRGAGRSRPYAEIAENTTEHLIEDLERLRRHLGVERWLVFGGSWGATLALAYGQTYAERCLGFVLRGVFLGRRDELDWFLHGMQRLFPEAKRHFAEQIPPAERHDLLSAYHKRLTDPDPQIHLPAAAAWCRYESACSRLVPNAADLRGGPIDGGRADLSIVPDAGHSALEPGILAGLVQATEHMKAELV